jgi:hypothetical protein
MELATNKAAVDALFKLDVLATIKYYNTNKQYNKHIDR